MSGDGAGKDREELADIEARARIEKLRLEQDSLRLQLSWHGRALEWLKAGSVLAALIGIAVTFYIGDQQSLNVQTAANDQVRQAIENRIAERFDKALGRLADHSDQAARLTGVASLRLFLDDSDEGHQREALHYLIAAIAEEADPTVCRAIIDAIRGARMLTPAALDDALGTAVEMDRSLTAIALRHHDDKVDADTRALTAKMLSKNVADLPDDNYRFGVRGLDFIQTLRVRTLSSAPYFSDPEPGALFGDEIALGNLADIIGLLVGRHAKNLAGNWSGVYCQSCNFRHAKLDDADFSNAFLRQADFTQASLRGAKLYNADLGGTVFFAADLSGADMHWTLFKGEATTNAVRLNPVVATLACATVYGADLSGLPLLLLIRNTSTNAAGDAITRDAVVAADLQAVRSDANTRMGIIDIQYVSVFSPAYYTGLPDPARKRFEQTFLNTEAMDWPTPLLSDSREIFADGPRRMETYPGANPGLAVLSVSQMTVSHRWGPLASWSLPLFRVALRAPIWAHFSPAREILAQTRNLRSMYDMHSVPGLPRNPDCQHPKVRYGETGLMSVQEVTPRPSR